MKATINSREERAENEDEIKIELNSQMKEWEWIDVGLEWTENQDKLDKIIEETCEYLLNI